jgi:hypothetical protein
MREKDSFAQKKQRLVPFKSRLLPCSGIFWRGLCTVLRVSNCLKPCPEVLETAKGIIPTRRPGGELVPYVGEATKVEEGV